MAVVLRGLGLRHICTPALSMANSVAASGVCGFWLNMSLPD